MPCITVSTVTFRSHDMNRSGSVVRTFDSYSDGTGSSPLAAISETGQFFSLRIASVHSAVQMSTWI